MSKALKWLFGSICLLVLLIGLLKLYDHFLMCDRGYIRLVCKEYNEGSRNDSFCKILCSEDISKRYLECLSNSHEKIVFKGNFDGKPLVVKFQTTGKSGNGEWEFFSLFNNSGWSVFYYGHCGGVYAVESILYPAGKVFGTAESFADLVFMPNALESLAESLNDNLSKVSVLGDLFQKIKKLYLYSCKLLFKFLHEIKTPTFGEKVDFLKKIFKMLESFVLSSQGRIVMCDIHLDNFGLSKDGLVKVIDGDHLFFIDNVTEMLSHRPCVESVDCRIGDFWDCYTHCNTSTNLCNRIIVLGNIRIICEVILSLVIHNLSDVELAILSRPYQALQQCASSDSKTMFEELEKAKKVIKSLEGINLTISN